MVVSFPRRQPTCPQRRKSIIQPVACGFTLAELLISLAILGIIATFVIPKILISQHDAKRRAIFKESIASVIAALNNGLATGELNASNQGTYFLTHINAIKLCPISASSEGCFPQPSSNAVERGQPGLIMPNGTTLAGLDDAPVCSNSAQGIIIDWNGPDGPNTMGDDQAHFYLYFDKNCPPYRAGTIDGDTSTDKQLYQDIFSNQ